MLRCVRSLHDARSLTLSCTFWPVVVGGGTGFLQEPCLRGRARWSPRPRGRARRGTRPRGWARQGEAEPPTQRLGETEPAPKRRAMRSPRPRGRARQGPRPRGLARRSPAPGVCWSCSRALDCSDESMLMTVSSSSSGTLELVPDSSPQACGGVDYSFGGFFEQEDSKGLGPLLLPTA